MSVFAYLHVRCGGSLIGEIVSFSELAEKRGYVQSTQNTIAAMPMSQQQLLDERADLEAYFLAIGFDWTAKGQPPQPVCAGFDPAIPYVRVERVMAKSSTVEEQAALRKKELAQMRADAATAVRNTSDEESQRQEGVAPTSPSAGENSNPNVAAPNTSRVSAPRSPASTTKGKMAMYETPARKTLNVAGGLADTLNKMNTSRATLAALALAPTTPAATKCLLAQFTACAPGAPAGKCIFVYLLQHSLHVCCYSPTASASHRE